MKCELCYQQGHTRYFEDITNHIETFHKHELRKSNEEEIRDVIRVFKSIFNDRVARKYFYISVIIGYAVSAFLIVTNTWTDIVH